MMIGLMDQPISSGLTDINGGRPGQNKGSERCVSHIKVKSKRQTYKLEQVQTPTLSHQILSEVSP